MMRKFDRTRHDGTKRVMNNDANKMIQQIVGGRFTTKD